MHQPLFLDFLEGRFFFVVGWLIGWVFTQAEKELGPGACYGQPGQVLCLLPLGHTINPSPGAEE